MLELSELANKWFSYAHRDFDTAEHLVNSMKPIPVEIVCFHCQQAAEKFLKGFIVNFNKPIQKTHDLRLLVNECAQINADFKIIEVV